MTAGGLFCVYREDLRNEGLFTAKIMLTTLGVISYFNKRDIILPKFMTEDNYYKVII